MSDYAVLQSPDTLRFERLLPGPIERVWAYISEPEKRRLWLAGGTADLVPGGNVELVFRHRELSNGEAPPERYAKYDKEISLHGVVIKCEPPRLLSHTWGDDKSEVTFELEPRGERVLLTVTHQRLKDRGAMLSVASGWHAHLGVLVDRLEEHELRPFWPALATLADEYETRLP